MDSSANTLAAASFYIKVGQIGSTRADILPQQYLDALETLQVRYHWGREDQQPNDCLLA